MSKLVWRVSALGRTAGAALVAGWVALALAITVSGSKSAAVSSTLWATALVVAVGVWRWAFVPYLVVTDSEVVVQNWLVRSIIACRDITEVEPGYYGLTITSRDGGRITAWAVQRSNWRRLQHATNTRADEAAEAIRKRAELRG